MEGWTKIKPASNYAGVSPRTSRKWLMRGLKHSRLPSGTILIRYSAIDQTLQSMPEPEGPARLVKQLSLLSKALAIVRGQTVVDLTIYEVVKKVSQDSLPRLRLIVLKSLWQMFCENQLAGDVNPLWFPTKDIADRSGVPISTTKLQLEDLRLLNLIVRNVESGNKNAQICSPSQQMTEWANKSQFFITS